MKDEFLKNWDTQLKKGLLPFLVLFLLRKREHYGYEVIEKLRTQFSLDVSESTIYPLLTRLQKEGILLHKWVEQEAGIPRKYYGLSPEGVVYLREMRKILNSMISKIDL